jgi:hypothetical protein
MHMSDKDRIKLIASLMDSIESRQYATTFMTRLGV